MDPIHCFFRKLALMFLTFNLILALRLDPSNPNRYLDLEYQNEKFVAEADSWTLNNLVSSTVKFYNCNGNYLLGGYGIFAGNTLGSWFQATYNLLPHTQVNLRFTFYAIDGWTLTDSFSIQFGPSITLQGWTFQQSSYTGLTNYCGDSGKLDIPPITAFYRIPHNDLSVTIRLISNLDTSSGAKSLGFRDIAIELLSPTTPTSFRCARTTVKLNADFCPCEFTNQYQSPADSGTCSTCHSDCKTCTGGAATNCASCIDGKYLSGTSCINCPTGCATCSSTTPTQCLSCVPGQFLANGACYTTCDYPLYVEGDHLVTKCKSPCPGFTYVNWDKSCSNTCDLPRLPSPYRGYNLCTFPCPTISHYLYWDGTCDLQCEEPLQKRTENHRNFCDFACPLTTDFLYWDASCRLSCLPPLQIETKGILPDTRDLCRFPCGVDQYLYWDGRCEDYCHFPRTAVRRDNRLFCEYSCTIPTDFLYWDKTCKNSCNPPLVQRFEGVGLNRFCEYPCDEHEFLFWNGTCSSCDFPLSRRYTENRAYCDFPCPSGDYLYWDASCHASCDFPLFAQSQGTTAPELFCFHLCKTEEYLYWNGTCSPECPFPLLQRDTNNQKFCDYPCADLTRFLFWNGSCFPSCPNPLKKVVEGSPSRNFCNYPCEQSEFLYWNRTCSSCDFPLTQRTTDGKGYCDYQCSPNQYLYWDATCSTSCDFPLDVEIQGTPPKQFCHFNCPTSQYSYWNGSCSFLCPFPLSQRTFKGFSFCDYPCDSSKYLNWIGECEASCSFPLATRVEGTPSRQFCDFPCSKIQFLAYNGECLPFCAFPLKARITDDRYFCDLPCSGAAPYYVTDADICNITCNASYVMSNKGDYLLCSPPEKVQTSGNLIEAATKPGAVTILTLVKGMQFLKIMNIRVPPRLQGLIESPGRSVLSTLFGVRPGDGIKEAFSRESSFSTSSSRLLFQNYYNNSPSFFINYWQTFFSLLLGIAVALLLYLFRRIAWGEGWKTAEKIFRRLEVIVKWNYVLITFASSVDEIILYAAWEFKSLKDQARAPWSASFSLLECLVALLLFIALIIAILMFVRRRRIARGGRRNRTTRAQIEFENKWEGFQTLYRGFKTDKKYNQYFYLIYIIRLGLPMVIALLVEKSPITVGVFQVLINLAILAYLLIVRPFEKTINTVQLFITEILMLIMNFCVLLLTVVSAANETLTDGAVRIGDAIIVGNDLLNISVLIFLVIKLVLETIAILRSIKVAKVPFKQEFPLFFQLLSLPIQQANMGFEEMITYYRDPNRLQPEYPNLKIKAALLNKIEKSGEVEVEQETNMIEISTDKLNNETNRTLLFPIDTENRQEYGYATMETSEKESFVASAHPDIARFQPGYQSLRKALYNRRNFQPRSHLPEGITPEISNEMKDSNIQSLPTQSQIVTEEIKNSHIISDQQQLLQQPEYMPNPFLIMNSTAQEEIIPVTTESNTNTNTNTIQQQPPPVSSIENHENPQPGETPALRRENLRSLNETIRLPNDKELQFEKTIESMMAETQMLLDFAKNEQQQQHWKEVQPAPRNLDSLLLDNQILNESLRNGGVWKETDQTQQNPIQLESALQSNGFNPQSEMIPPQMNDHSMIPHSTPFDQQTPPPNQMGEIPTTSNERRSKIPSLLKIKHAPTINEKNHSSPPPQGERLSKQIEEEQEEKEILVHQENQLWKPADDVPIDHYMNRTDVPISLEEALKSLNQKQETPNDKKPEEPVMQMREPVTADSNPNPQINQKSEEASSFNRVITSNKNIPRLNRIPRLGMMLQDNKGIPVEEDPLRNVEAPEVIPSETEQLVFEGPNQNLLVEDKYQNIGQDKEKIKPEIESVKHEVPKIVQEKEKTKQESEKIKREIKIPEEERQQEDIKNIVKGEIQRVNDILKNVNLGDSGKKQTPAVVSKPEIAKKDLIKKEKEKEKEKEKPKEKEKEKPKLIKEEKKKEEKKKEEKKMFGSASRPKSKASSPSRPKSKDSSPSRPKSKASSSSPDRKKEIKIPKKGIEEKERYSSEEEKDEVVTAIDPPTSNDHQQSYNSDEAYLPSLIIAPQHFDKKPTAKDKLREISSNNNFNFVCNDPVFLESPINPLPTQSEDSVAIEDSLRDHLYAEMMRKRDNADNVDEIKMNSNFEENMKIENQAAKQARDFDDTEEPPKKRHEKSGTGNSLSEEQKSSEEVKQQNRVKSGDKNATKNSALPKRKYNRIAPEK